MPGCYGIVRFACYFRGCGVGMEFVPEPWMLELKRQVEAGRYRTEEALGQQEPFPWQDKRCADCPFWLDSEWCDVYAMDRRRADHTCGYFDPGRRRVAKTILEQRAELSRRGFFDWQSGDS